MIKIELTKSAEYDLIDIEYHISIELCNWQASDRIIDGIMDVILELKKYPLAHAFVEDECWRMGRVRMAHFAGYNIFYHYNARKQIVCVLRILHERVDWKDKLHFYTDE